MQTALRSLCLASLLAAPTLAGEVHPDVTRRLAELEQPVKVWVMLTDKGPVSELAAGLELAQAQLSPRQRERRALRRSADGLVDARDLPLVPRYLSELAAAGAELQVESTWLNAVSAFVDEASLARVARLPFVSELRLVARSAPLTTPAPRCAPAGGGGSYGFAQTQVEQITVDLLHGQGFTGAGVVIGVLDTGFATDHQVFQDAQHPLTVLAQKDFVDDDLFVGPEAGDDPSQHEHGTLILGTMAAYQPDSLIGMAYDASYVLCKTEDVTQEVQGEEDAYVAGLQFAEAQGADVVTSSLGYIDWYTQTDLDGATAVTTLAVNVAIQNGVICCTAAGNSGNDQDPATSSLIAPADAFEVLTCGAVLSTGEIASFSSNGPSADGRVKPELLAMGQDTATIAPWDTTSFVTVSGTSLSTPLLAGAVACLLQAHPSWGVSKMRSRLLASAGYFGAATPDPLYVTGYGIVDARAAHEDFLLGAPAPGLAGQTSSSIASGAVPGNPILLGWSVSTGLLPLPGCTGVSAGLGPIALLQLAFADVAGDALFQTNVPASASGLSVHAQAVDLLGCLASAVRAVDFP